MQLQKFGTSRATAAMPKAAAGTKRPDTGCAAAAVVSGLATAQDDAQRHAALHAVRKP